MLLSEFISDLQEYFDKYGDATIYYLGECGEHEIPYIYDINGHYDYTWNEAKQDTDEKYIIESYILGSHY